MAKPSKRIVKNGAPLTETGQVIPTGKPIIDRTERDRAESTLKEYTLTPEQLKAYNDKHGWPTKPLNKRGGLAHRPVKGGKGA